MSGCGNFDDEIVDVAFGVAPSASLAAHVQSCPACAERLESRRARARRIDEAVRSMVRVDAPQHSIARSAQRRHPSRTWRMWPLPVGLAAAALLGAVVVQFHPVAHGEPDVAALVHWKSPTAVLLKPETSIVQTPLTIHVEHVL